MSTDCLRPVIADILADQGYAAGAATLRELHAEEGALDDEEVKELDHLRGLVETIEDLLTHLDGATGKPMTAAAFRREVKLILDGAEL